METRDPNFFKVQNNDIERILQQSEKQVCTLLFEAEWSGAAHMVHHFLQDLSEDYRNSMTFFYAKESEASTLIQHFEVNSIPTILVIKDGQETERLTGLPSRKKINQFLEEASS